MYYSREYIISTQNIYSRQLCFFFVISAITVFLIYVSTNFSTDFLTTRYLTFTALSIYLLISISYNKNIKYILLVFLILLSGVNSNYAFIKDLDYQPNQLQLGLIENLKDNGLQYGVGDYWDSNIMTYLSREKVIIRPVFARDGTILSRRWLSSDRWVSEFSDKSKNLSKFFILFRANDTLKMDDLRLFLKYNQPIETKTYRANDTLKMDDLSLLFRYNQPIETKPYENYTIYVYNQIV